MIRLLRAAPAAALAAALLAPVRTTEQLVLALGLGLALAGMAAWGWWLERHVLWPGSASPRLRPFQAVYLGQLTVLALAGALLPLGGLLASAIGRELPLLPILAIATAAAAWSSARAWRGRDLLRPLTLCGVACLAVVMALYSRHLSALGLDLHQHATWARDVLRAGHVPLTERGTAILAGYPRTFHLLLALWDAAALGAPIGPWAKAMPFLQNALPALAIAEAVAEAAARARPGTASRVEVVMGIAFGVYAFALVPMAYPAADLSGTPRLSSNGVLLAPAILLVLAHLHPGGRARLLALGALPLVAAWCLTLNPAVLVLLAVAGLPLLAAVAVALPAPAGPPQGPRGRGRSAAVLAACALGAVMVVTADPWVLAQVARRVAPIEAVLARHGIDTWERARARGVVTDRESWLGRPAPVPACGDARCATRAVGRAAGEAAADVWRSARSAMADAGGLARAPAQVGKAAFRAALLPAPAQVFDWAGLPFVAVVCAGIAAAGLTVIRGGRGAFCARFLAAALGAVAVGGFGVRFAGRLARLLSDGSPEREILAFYLDVAGLHLSVGVLWLPFAAAVACLVEAASGRPRAAEEPAMAARRPIALVAAAAAAWIALPQLAQLNLDLPRRNQGFWSPVRLADVGALRRIERSLPAQEAALVPAEHWHVGVEEWVIPVGDTTALLPYGDGRYLFNVYLGRSYRYGWRDLEERLCSPDPARRRELLAEAGVKWLLARARGARTAGEILGRTEICGKPIGAIGEATPVQLDGDLALFRLRVP